MPSGVSSGKENSCCSCDGSEKEQALDVKNDVMEDMVNLVNNTHSVAKGSDTQTSVVNKPNKMVDRVQLRKSKSSGSGHSIEGSMKYKMAPSINSDIGCHCYVKENQSSGWFEGEKLRMASSVNLCRNCQSQPTDNCQQINQVENDKMEERTIPASNHNNIDRQLNNNVGNNKSYAVIDKINSRKDNTGNGIKTKCQSCHVVSQHYLKVDRAESGCQSCQVSKEHIQLWLSSLAGWLTLR